MIPLDEEHPELLVKIAAVHLNEVENLLERLELAMRAGDELLAMAYTYRMQQQLNAITHKAASLAD